MIKIDSDFLYKALKKGNIREIKIYEENNLIGFYLESDLKIHISTSYNQNKRISKKAFYKRIHNFNITDANFIIVFN